MGIIIDLLTGITKLRDAWPKINQNFTNIKTEVDANVLGSANALSQITDDYTALDARVDTIIATPAEGVSAEEIVDARVGEGSLGAKIRSVDTQLAESVQQLIPIVRENNISTGYNLTPTDLHFDCIKIESDHVGSKRETGEEFLLAFNDDFANDPNNNGANTFSKYSSLNGDNITYECSNTKNTPNNDNIYVVGSNIAQPIPNKGWTDIGFNKDVINKYSITMGNPGSTNTTFEIKKSGTYVFSYNIGFSETNAIGVRLFDIVKNGVINIGLASFVPPAYQTPLAGGLTADSIFAAESVPIQCVMGDIIGLSVYQDSGNILNILTNDSSPLFSIKCIDVPLNYDLEYSSMNFTNNENSYAEALYATPIVPKGPVFHAVLDVLDEDLHFAPRVGLLKDADNWVDVCYSKIDSGFSAIEVKIGGVFTAFNGTFPVAKFVAPYKLHFMLCNIEIVMAIEKDGKLYKLVEHDISSLVNFTDYATLKSFSLFFGCSMNAIGKHGRLGGLKAGYSIGTSFIQDMRPVTYEDGQPIKRNGWKYLLASTHPVDNILGAIGTKLFRYNNIKFEYIGMMFNRVGSRIFGGNSDKLIYDRNLKTWIYISGNWSDVPIVTYIGTTNEDILKGGIFVVNTAPMLLPEDDAINGVYDMDMIYVNGKYKIVYAIYAPGQYTSISECSTFNGQYTRVIKIYNNGLLREGNVFTKIGGVYYVTSANGGSALGIWSSVDLSFICSVNTNRFPATIGSPPPWGCIVAEVNKHTTNYLLLLFSSRKTFMKWNGISWDSVYYGYGDLWVFESRETQPAQEFENKDLLYFD